MYIQISYLMHHAHCIIPPAIASFALLIHQYDRHDHDECVESHEFFPNKNNIRMYHYASITYIAELTCCD